MEFSELSLLNGYFWSIIMRVVFARPFRACPSKVVPQVITLNYWDSASLYGFIWGTYPTVGREKL